MHTQAVPAEQLNFIEEHNFPSLSGAPCPVVLVIGGIHGNEAQGIAGAALFADHLKRSYQYPVISQLRRAAHLVVVPVLNQVGFLAKARCCPTTGVLVNVDKSGQVIVAENQKGGINPPPGWKDPNRGWSDNDTLAMFHLKRLLSVHRPVAVIFNHDWAVPQAKIGAYSAQSHIDRFKQVAEKLFALKYPTKKPFGEPWQFVQPPSETDTLGWALWNEQQLPNYVIETCVTSSDGSRVHLVMNILLSLAHAQETLLTQEEVTKQLEAILKTQ